MVFGTHNDGYRLRVERDGDRVRLITRGGYDWTKRYPWIVEAARKVRQRRYVIDGEAVEPAPCLIPSLSRETARDRLGIDAIGQRFRLYAVNRLAVCAGQVRTP
jgi:ATP dependent DNA ligase domain